MSLSDCEECWGTPCTCGYEYRHIKTNYFAEYIFRITQYRTKKEAVDIFTKAIKLVNEEENWIEK